MNLVIVDYGIGNIRSVQNAFLRLGLVAPKVSRELAELSDAQGLILPGVGAFSECSNKLQKLGIIDLLTELVMGYNKPILGICVGMQLMAETSTEGGLHTGLGWIPGNVVKLDLPRNFHVPHVGWNNINFTNDCPLFSRVEENTHYYFDHSYHFLCDKSFTTATTRYGLDITAAIQHKNIFGVQFHPEKSANAGLKLFRGFENYIKQC